MRVSILDFFANPRDSIELAVLAERLGYWRYWIGEHHAPYQCPNPLLLAAVIAQRTQSIRVGSGATSVMLRSPKLIAEDARLIDLISPSRLDLGVAPALAVSKAVIAEIVDGREASTDDYESRVCRLHRYMIEPGAQPPHAGGAGSPTMWLLGMSHSSARLAAKLGLGFCTSFHHGGTIASVSEAIDVYRTGFQASPASPGPRAVVVISGLCATTESECDDLRRRATPPPSPANNEIARPVEFFGDVKACGAQITEAARLVGSDEVLVLSLAMKDAGTENAVLYQLLAEELNLNGAGVGKYEPGA